MWNVKSVKPYLSQDILIKSVVHLIANGRQGQSLLGSIKTQMVAKKALKDGIEAPPVLFQTEDIEKSQNQNILQSFDLLGVSKIVLDYKKKRKLEIGNTAKAPLVENITELLSANIKKRKKEEYLRNIKNICVEIKMLANLTWKQLGRSLMDLSGDVLGVDGMRTLLLTTSSRFQRVGQTILATYNRFVGVVTVQRVIDYEI